MSQATIAAVVCRHCGTDLEWRFGMFLSRSGQPQGAPYCPTCDSWFTADNIATTRPICVLADEG